MFFKRFIKYSGKQNRRANGFTLIEVLIAMAIFAIGILGVAKMQISAINGNASARKYTEAAVKAQEQIEILMMSTFVNINNDSASSDSADNGYTVEPPQNGYTIKWKVTNFIDLAPTTGVDLKEVNVIVEDPRGRERANISFAKLKDL